VIFNITTEDTEDTEGGWRDSIEEDRGGIGEVEGLSVYSVYSVVLLR